MATYEVPEQNMGWLREKIEKLNRKAEKLDVQPITLRVLGERLVDVPRRRARDSVEASLVAVEGHAGFMTLKFVKVEVTGSAPILAGWRFIATLQHVADNGDSATIIHAVPGETVPTQYRETDGRWCDHCRTRRVRNDTFIVREHAGCPTPLREPVHKQVGRQCLRDFLGHPKPEMYADWATDLGLLDDLFRSAEHEYSEGPVWDRIFRTESYLAVVGAAIRKYGWVSGKMAHEAEERGEMVVRTRDVASSYMLHDAETALQVTEADARLAEKVVAWGRDGLVAMVRAKPDNDYLYNLAQVLKLDALNYRMLGIAASAVNVYQREMQKNVSYEDRAAVSNYVGTPGVRFEFVAEVRAVRSITYGDGTTGTVIEFADDEGNELVWFTGGSHGFQPGKTYRVKASVKRHSEYRGVKQTAINRAQKMEEIA